MDVSAKAKALGEAIQASEQFKNLQVADVAYQSDEEAQKLTDEYNAKRSEIAEESKKENITPHELVELRQTAAFEFAKLEKNAVIKGYIDAKKDFEAMMGEVDAILRHYITGEEENSCGDSCSSCSGCH